MNFKRGLLFFCLGLSAIGWLGYSPFLAGYWFGIYPLAVLYSRLFSLPAVLLFLVVFRFWLWFAIAAFLCIVLIRVTRQRIYRRALVGILALPLLTLTLLPAVATFVPGPSLTVQPWGQTYRTAYSAFASDDTYGSGLVFQCDRSSILCRQVHQFSESVGGIDEVKLTYKPDLDHLILTDSGDSVLYWRSRQMILCAEINPFPSGTDCNQRMDRKTNLRN